MELAEGGEVFDRICEEGAYSEADAASVLRQVALALAFMHSIGVVHRDLKPENLLLTSTNEVKVADFGLAAYVGGEGRPPLTEVCGTIAYMAPEMIAALKPRGGHPPKPYGAEVDLFSLGGILFALLGAYTPFDPNNDQSDEGIQERITKGQWGFDDFPDRAPTRPASPSTLPSTPRCPHVSPLPPQASDSRYAPVLSPASHRIPGTVGLQVSPACHAATDLPCHRQTPHPPPRTSSLPDWGPAAPAAVTVWRGRRLALLRRCACRGDCVARAAPCPAALARVESCLVRRQGLAASLARAYAIAAHHGRRTPAEWMGEWRRGE